MNRFLPEGALLDTPHNQLTIRSATNLAEAAMEGRVVEARAVLCDADHNLHVEMRCMEGIIPYYEGAVGIAEGTTRDIALISRVSKPVCFTVSGFEHLPDGRRRAVLSRRDAQERCRYEYIQNMRCGDIVPARITRLETFGAFCDIGCGLPALLPIAGISVSRISHPSDRFVPGMDIFGVVSSLENNRICLSQRELLGTWEENAALFSQGETVAGVVRSVESYGIFVELTPNLAGLAVVYAMGMGYYSWICSHVLGSPIGLWPLILYCFLLAVPGDLVLSLLAAGLARRLRPIVTGQVAKN